MVYPNGRRVDSSYNDGGQLAVVDDTNAADEPVTVERLTTSFNEYYSVGGKAQTHDLNGNLMDDGLHTFTWDAFNRMATASDNSGLIVTYLYDATNRRVAKAFPEGSDFADVEYAYSNWQVLGEYEDGQTYPSRQFVYGNYIDEPLVMDVNADASGGTGNATCIGAEDARYFYHAGQIYSVAAMSDASGVIVEGWRYDPYGRHVRLTDGDADGAVEFDGTDLRATLTASALGNPYTFTGRRFDPETQLHHYRNRYYDSRRGRFISRDPIGYQGGINLYEYVKDNPVILVDPSGLDTYFAIYYANDDNYSFERAAKTWVRELKRSDEYNNKCDEIILKGVDTRKDFITAWDEIDERVQKRKKIVIGEEWKIRSGRIFSHGGSLALFFMRDDPSVPGSGSLNIPDIQKLKKLDWRERGRLVIHSCNSGLIPGYIPGVDDTCVGEQFCLRQDVAVFGMPGGANFSRVPPPEDYKRIDLHGEYWDAQMIFTYTVTKLTAAIYHR